MKKTRILMTVHLALWLMVGLCLQAAAYIDPSVVSGLLVSVAGAVVACSAAFFILWRKFKKKVSKTLEALYFLRLPASWKLKNPLLYSLKTFQTLFSTMMEKHS